MRHFLEGKRLRDERRCGEAIAPLEASVAIEPSIGAHYNLGFCNHALGNAREALRHYDAALSLAKERDDDREREIRAQREEFLDKTAHLRLVVVPPIPPDVRIVVGGEPVSREDLAGEVHFFPSRDGLPSYEIVATAAGYEETRITVDGGAMERHDLVHLTLSKAAPSRVLGSSADVAPAERSARWTWQRWAGAGTAAVGLVALGVGGYLGVDYLAERPGLDRRLRGEPCLSPDARLYTCPQGTAANHAARALVRENNALEGRGTVGLVAAVAGGALVTTGLVLFLTAPSADAEAPAKIGKLTLAPAIGPRERALALSGSF